LPGKQLPHTLQSPLLSLTLKTRPSRTLEVMVNCSMKFFANHKPCSLFLAKIGNLDASQGVTGEKEVSLQGHPSGLYHFKFTVKKSDGECEIPSEAVLINSDSHSNDAPSDKNLDDIFNDLDSNKNATGSPNVPPSDQELDDIFNSLYNHGNDEGWHEDDVESNGTPAISHGDAITQLVDDIENNDLSGWHSNEDDVEGNGSPTFGHSDSINQLVDDIENNDLSGWHSNEDDVEGNGTPNFSHSKATNELADNIENKDVPGWHSNDNDIEGGDNNGQPQTFDDLIKVSCTDPYV
jgi:hypothetical protein